MLSQHANTKLDILPIAKKDDQPIIEFLSDHENEEDYELRLHISTITLDDTSTKEVNRI